MAALLAAAVTLPLVATSTCLVRQLGGAFTRQPEELGNLSEAARVILERAFSDVDAARLRDYHVHVLGLGTGGSGTWVNPEMLSWGSPVKRFKFAVYLSASGIETSERADREYVERLVALARGHDRHGKLFVVAFDQHHRPDGTVKLEKTEFYVPNAYVFALAAEFPDVFEPVMSVHPYRHDALDELDRWAERGGRLVKWLPNAMGIDPADPRCDSFYARMKERNLVLLSHAGEEQAVEAEEDQRLGNPLRLRRPLEAGVRVIVAHCASLGMGEDLDAPGAPPQTNFALFLRLMDEPRYAELLFGDISSVTQWNRLGEPLHTLLRRQELHSRLVNGSDYPLPAINALVSTGDLVEEGYLTAAEREALNELYDYNPLLFDYVLKRTIREPHSGRRFAAQVFMAHPALESAR